MRRHRLGTRRNDPEGLRTRVLDAAADLFQSRGYHATGMREVISATETSSGALHHHFPTKESLGLAVIANRVAPAVRETWIEPIRRAESLQSGIRKVFGNVIRGIDRRGAVRGCPLNNLAVELAYSDPLFREAVQAIFAEWQAALEARVADSLGGGRLGRAQRAAAAAFIISSYSGAMNLAKATQSAAPLRVAARALSAWLREQQFVPG